MSNKRRTPTEKELSLWREMMQGVEPMHDDVDQDSTDTPDEFAPPKARQNKTKKHSPVSPAHITAPAQSAYVEKQLDRRTDEKLLKGKMPIEATLDLHGMTQSQAHICLEQFILQSYKAGKRCVLVITGKGSRQSENNYILSERSEKGVLKARLPEWLRQAPLDNIVLKSVTAHQKHGGGGAFYVYLRNKGKDY